jgi:hypothetical protein
MSSSSRFTTSWLEGASGAAAPPPPPPPAASAGFSFFGSGVGVGGVGGGGGGDAESGAAAGGADADDGGGGGESSSFLPSFVRASSGLFGGGAAAPPPPPEWACGLTMAQRLQVGGVLLLGAAVLFSAALFVFLPMVLLFPGKFASAFSSGSVLTLAAMALFRGPRTFLLGLLERDRLAFSAAYIASLALTLYAALAGQSYFLVVFAVAVQVAALLWYASTFVPGGTTGMSFLTRMFFSSALSGARGAFSFGGAGR